MMTKLTTTFAGFKLKGLRTKMQYDLAYTAQQLDITKSYLSLIENGKKQPSKKVLTKAAKCFDVPLETFNEDPELLTKLKQLTKDTEISEVIHAFEIILHEKS